MTPGVERWLRHLAENGPSHRPKGSVGRRAMTEGLTDWWVLDRKTGAGMLRSDVPSDHIPWGDRYDYHGEALTPLGRAALDAITPRRPMPKRWRVTLESREDGGMRVYSKDIPGLALSGKEIGSVLTDLGPALRRFLAPNTETQRDAG